MKTLASSNSIRTKKSPLSIKLDPAKKEQLELLAQKKERSVHFLLCHAVSEYIENETKRLEFYEEALRASNHYKETGLHVTHEEMMAWAESLGTDNELLPPVCHK